MRLSTNAGESWEEVGTTGGEPQALVAADPMTLYAILIDGTVKKSTDGGATWTNHVKPPA
jgi:photosystem II stability/assembly factor-like uncharacterized protein